MDLFEKFVAGEFEETENITQGGNGAGNAKIDEKLPRIVSNNRVGFKAGDRVNYMRVEGPHVKKSRHGTYTGREYVVVCEAPGKTRGAVCGWRGIVSYHQLYYRNVYSCGCTPRPKHPPVRLEGQRFGTVEVLRWTGEYGGSWEAVCHECGELLYRSTSKQARAAGASCRSHGKVFA